MKLLKRFRNWLNLPYVTAFFAGIAWSNFSDCADRWMMGKEKYVAAIANSSSWNQDWYMAAASIVFLLMSVHWYKEAKAGYTTTS